MQPPIRVDADMISYDEDGNEYHSEMTDAHWGGSDHGLLVSTCVYQVQHYYEKAYLCSLAW